MKKIITLLLLSATALINAQTAFKGKGDVKVQVGANIQKGGTGIHLTYDGGRRRRGTTITTAKVRTRTRARTRTRTRTRIRIRTRSREKNRKKVRNKMKKKREQEKGES